MCLGRVERNLSSNSDLLVVSRFKTTDGSRCFSGHCTFGTDDVKSANMATTFRRQLMIYHFKLALAILFCDFVFLRATELSFPKDFGAIEVDVLLAVLSMLYSILYVPVCTCICACTGCLAVLGVDEPEV